jgi:lambda repressor-like predicted transcriptional regulator
MSDIIPGREAHPGKQGRELSRASEDQLKTIHHLASQGKSLRIIAARIGISYTTLDAWLGNSREKAKYADPRVRAAWEAGIAEHEDALTGVLHSAIDNPKHKMQIPAAMFMLKVKHKWSERHEVAVSEQPKAPVKFKTKDITPDQDSE